MKREYPETPLAAVSGVIFNDEGHVLLVRRGRPPAKGKWSLPGGVVHLGEELEAALAREVFEECGLKVVAGPLLSVSSRIVHDSRGEIQFHYILLDYLCRCTDGVLRAGSDARDARWVRVDKVGRLDITEGLLSVIMEGYNQKDKIWYRS